MESKLKQQRTTTTTTVIQPGITALCPRLPGEPVPEETFTHSGVATTGWYMPSSGFYGGRER